MLSDDSSGIPRDEGNKKVAEISLSDQILLFIVQREAIVDITGTLKTKPDSLTNQRLPGINIANICFFKITNKF